ncbi:MAG: class I SAM-dependent methyltransferase [Chitinophagaceae bacterium]|nr:class I SAM-dependent methyltransferase [Chitinophagaceae bacterium]
MAPKKNWKWRLAQQLEYRWWQRYLRHKDVSAYTRDKQRYWHTMLADIAPWVSVNRGQEVLDAGCGPAGVYMVLEQDRVTAIDPLLDKYGSLPHFRPEQYPWVQFEQLPLEVLDKTAQFDLIFCLNAINHVNDLELSYDRLVQALKPGGTLVVSTDAHRNTFLKKIFQWIPGDLLHPVQMDLPDYEARLTGRGLDLVHSGVYKHDFIFDYCIMIARKP